jgi:hypothetical protein
MSYNLPMKAPLSIRLDGRLLAQLRTASNGGPYAPTVTQIVERGIVLALRELERKGRK